MKVVLDPKSNLLYYVIADFLIIPFVGSPPPPVNIETGSPIGLLLALTYQL